MSLTLFNRLLPRRRHQKQQAYADMVVQSMESLIDVYNEDAIYRRIGDSAREMSGAECVYLIFFTPENREYEVRASSCAKSRIADAAASVLPFKPSQKYPVRQVSGLARLILTRQLRAYKSLADFLGEDNAHPAAGAPIGIKSVVAYPLVLEKQIRGSLILLNNHQVRNPEAYRIFAVQCSLVMKFSQQITELNEMRRLEEQLHQAQKMEAVGQLAGGIAHDFNNMLAGISGYAYLIRRKSGEGETELKNFADAIITASKRAADLTGKLLAFARKGIYQTIAVDIHAVIHEVVALLEHTLDKRIQIRHEFTARTATVMGDPTQLQNMILNLAINARDAMPGAGMLTFRTATVRMKNGLSSDGQYEIKEGPYLVVGVTDTGSGMDDQTKKRLFEPFFTTKEIGKGTGLGLASVYGTVKAHGGFITVESTKGKGSAFTVHLPQVADKDSIIDPPPKTESIIRGHGNIMVVDDEEMIRNLSREILTYLGYTVHTCKDGIEAIQYYREHHATVDLVLLDVIMPKMDGYETFRELKKIKVDVRVIITTGYSLKEDTQQIINKGICGFIQKPFESGKLSQIVNDVMHGKLPVNRTASLLDTGVINLNTMMGRDS